MAGPWIIRSRKNRWGSGKTHYASEVVTVLGDHRTLCTTSAGQRERGRHEDVDCQICVRLTKKSSE